MSEQPLEPGIGRNEEIDQALIQLLGESMAVKLRLYRHKAHWSNLAYDARHRYLMKRLREEVDELEEAIAEGGLEEIASECGDVANFAAMILDNHQSRCAR